MTASSGAAPLESGSAGAAPSGSGPAGAEPWDFASLWAQIADGVGDRPALLHGDLVRSWSQFVDRAARLAAAFADAGVGGGDRIGILARNHPAWMESFLAALWIGATPFNVNWRYGPTELADLLGDAPTAALVVDEEHLAVASEAIERTGLALRRTVVIGDDSPSYQAALSRPPRPRPSNSGEEIIDLYTGGTTGAPKAVMWRQGDLWQALGSFTGAAAPTMAEALAGATGGGGLRALVACPLMHGTGLFVALQTLSMGGTVITTPQRGFDPAGLAETIVAQRPQLLAIVGDAFARPFVAHLEQRADGASVLDSVMAVVSSGTMWSEDVKRRFLELAPGRLLIDALSSSEAVGVAASTAGADAATARFRAGARTRVVDDDLRTCPIGEEGWIALGPPNPVGYRGDPVKSTATFRVIDGQRWCLPGDRGRMEGDGMLVLLGRGNACINTGGEKVHAEEVEEVLKRHRAVADAAVVGVPDERLGQVVAAVVELVPSPDACVAPAVAGAAGSMPTGAVAAGGVGSGAPEGPTADELRDHVRAHLAGYKVPKVVLIAPVERQPSGKLDYRAIQARIGSALLVS